MSLGAYTLLVKAATISMKRNEVFSKHEIHKKLSEIKYLAAQKKIPKISLRKELIHLENELESVFKLEDYLLKRQKYEDKKIGVLKASITKLKKKIALSEDKDLQRKVEKLSHLLGQCLAHEKVKEEVATEKAEHIKEAPAIKSTTAIQIDSPHHTPPPQIGDEPTSLHQHSAPPQVGTIPTQGIPQPTLGQETTQMENAPIQSDFFTLNRIRTMRQRLVALKHELEISEHLAEAQDKDIAEKKIKALEVSIATVDQKLEAFLAQHPDLNPSIKHTMIMTPEQKDLQTIMKDEKTADIAADKELPLPPPPF